MERALVSVVAKRGIRISDLRPTPTALRHDLVGPAPFATYERTSPHARTVATMRRRLWLCLLWNAVVCLLVISLPEPWLWLPLGLILLVPVTSFATSFQLARSRCPHCGGFFCGARGRQWPAVNIYRSTCGLRPISRGQRLRPRGKLLSNSESSCRRSVWGRHTVSINPTSSSVAVPNRYACQKPWAARPARSAR